MPNLEKEISLSLRQKYSVNEQFYPKISMETDIPEGLEGEINRIMKALQENELEITEENVFHVMEFKKELLQRYIQTPKGKETIAKYRRLLLEEIRPTGITIPIELLLANGLLVLLLYMIGRFAGSFADESGKLLARRLLEKDKECSKALNMNVEEYRFLREEATTFILDGKTLEILRKNLKKRE